MSNESDEVDILDLFGVILKRKVMIIGITLCGIVFALVYSIGSLLMTNDKSYLPNVYTPKAIMLINDSSSSGGSMSSLLSSSGMGSLASLAGLSVSGGSKYSALAVYIAETNGYLDQIVDHFELISRYKINRNPRSSSRNALKRALKAKYDEESSVFTIAFTDRDPVFAQSVVNFAVESMEKRFTEMGIDKNKLTKENLEINLKNSFREIVRLQAESQRIMGSVNHGQALPLGSSVMLETTRLDLELKAQEEVYTQLKTLYELFIVRLAIETPVFLVLEYAEVPDQKSGPGRGKLCIIVAFTSFLLSDLLAFMLNAIDNIRKDPEAMAKLQTVSK